MPELTPNQIVASNLRGARLLRGWTQVEAAERLEPHLGTRWSEAVFSAAERSIDGKRIREFTADDLVALSNAFDLPITFFLLPPRTTAHVPIHSGTMKFAEGLVTDVYTGDVPAPDGADTAVVDVATPAGTTSAVALLERLLALDEHTSARLRALAESLSDDERHALYGRLDARRADLGASRLGDLKKHTQGLRELADLLEGIEQDFEARDEAQ